MLSLVEMLVDLVGIQSMGQIVICFTYIDQISQQVTHQEQTSGRGLYFSGSTEPYNPRSSSCLSFLLDKNIGPVRQMVKYGC